MIVAYDLDVQNCITGSTFNYNSSSLLLGDLIKYYNDSEQSYVKPLSPATNRLFDYYGADYRYIDVIPYDDKADYVASAYWAVATQTTLTSLLAKYDYTTGTWTNCGRIFTTPITGAGGARNATAIKGKLYRYSSGSVQVSGSLVTGSNTFWATNRIFQGSRIGFGTTSSREVTKWYEIFTKPTEDQFFITDSASFSPGTPYIIEELKFALTFTNSSNGSHAGVLLIQGVHEDAFSYSGTTINPMTGSLVSGGVAPTAMDRTRSFVRLAESSASILFSPGPAVFDKSYQSPTQDYLYVMNIRSGNSIEMARFNIANPINTVFTGSSFNQFETLTSASNAGFTITRYMSLAKPSHGPGSGSYNLYQGGPSRINRISLSDIYSGSTSFIKDNWFEVPPGGTNTYATIGLSNVAYVPSIDRFIFAGNTTAGSFFQSGIVSYNTSGSETERRVLTQLLNYNRITTSPQMPYIYSSNFSNPIYESDGKMAYTTFGGASTDNVLLSIPIGADYEAAPQNKEWATFPKMDLPGIKSYKRIFVKYPKFVGPEKLGVSVERVVIYCRTTGIADDSGPWTRIFDGGNLSDIPVSEEIQFSISWDVLGTSMAVPPIYGITLVYETDSQDNHYVPSVSKTNVLNRQFVWRQAQLFTEGYIPNLRVRLYNSETENLLLEDTSATQTQGVFQYSSDGGNNWNSWNIGVNSVTNHYIRYTANSLPANTLINAVITLA